MHRDETAIVPYLRGELGDAERRECQAHLAGCVDCRRVADDFRATLEALAPAVPKPPDVHWGRYRVELSEKLERRLGRGATSRRWWPVSVALSSVLAAVLVFLAGQDTGRETRVADFGVVEETVIGDQLEMLQQYPLVERLDLLEDLEVIRHLDQLASVKTS